MKLDVSVSCSGALLRHLLLILLLNVFFFFFPGYIEQHFIFASFCNAAILWLNLNKSRVLIKWDRVGGFGFHVEAKCPLLLSKYHI